MQHRKRRTAAAAALASALVAGPLLIPPAGAAAAPAPGGHHEVITLLTGDRVHLTAGGEIIGVERGEGRDGIPVSVRSTADGARYVVPRDAEALIARGAVDPRLFDVAELSRPAYDRVAGDGLPVLVRYAAEPPARLFSDAAPEVRAELESVNGRALTVAPDQAAAVWEELTGPRTLASGVTSVSLDGFRRASLDTSVPRIGAPDAWAAGFDGTGVTIAVLDTGIDATHPDLAGGKVVAEANFAGTPDTLDHDGHGTHVASTAAGTGAHSGGAFTGVAPGAVLLNGKVLDDGGWGQDSGIIAGMEWAVEQGADIVNLSLGGYDTPEIDPLEEAVNRLSADSDTLFVIAAGNDGPGAGTLSSPASADAALAVGAVDDADRTAGFSSQGPRLGGGVIKPDLAAPGVDIGAAAAEGSRIAEEGEPVADGYVAISGTSMASPHVAGAAALLAQRHPEWTGEQLKAALVGSAEPAAGAGAFAQGSGRVDVTRALDQTVVTEEVSVDFGLAQWPHEDDAPVTRTLTYSNLGTEDVTLDLALGGLAPDGSPAPEGMFTASTGTLAVPAGGSASVELTADTRMGGEVFGAYSLFVTATGDGGQSVRTAAAVEREAERYELTVRAVGRDGAAHPDWGVSFLELDGAAGAAAAGGTGPFGRTATGGTVRAADSATFRVPPGDYLLAFSGYLTDAEGYLLGGESMVQPHLRVTEDTTVTFDAREAGEVDLSVPDPDVWQTELHLGWLSTRAGFGDGYNLPPDLPEGFRVGHVGPRTPEGEFSAYASTGWLGDGVRYHTSYASGDGWFDGLADRLEPAELAELTVSQGTVGEGRSGRTVVFPQEGPATGWSPETGGIEPLPFTATEYVRAEGMRWAVGGLQYGPDGGDEGGHQTASRAYEPGGSYDITLGAGVLGPHLNGVNDLTRDADHLYTTLDQFADGQGNFFYNGLYDELSMTLTRDGEVIGTLEDARHCQGYDLFPPYLPGCVRFEVPREEAAYEWEISAGRSSLASVSTEVTTAFSFVSGAPEGEAEEALPLSVVRFTPELALDSTAPAGARTRVPVTVEGSAAGAGLGALTVEVSCDGGETWRRAAVRAGAVTVTNPPAGGSVSFRARVTDRDGNATEQTIIDAYRTS